MRAGFAFSFAVSLCVVVGCEPPVEGEGEGEEGEGDGEEGEGEASAEDCLALVAAARDGDAGVRAGVSVACVGDSDCAVSAATSFLCDEVDPAAFAYAADTLLPAEVAALAAAWQPVCDAGCAHDERDRALAAAACVDGACVLADEAAVCAALTEPVLQAAEAATADLDRACAVDGDCRLVRAEPVCFELDVSLCVAVSAGAADDAAAALTAARDAASCGDVWRDGACDAQLPGCRSGPRALCANERCVVVSGE